MAHNLTEGQRAFVEILEIQNYDIRAVRIIREAMSLRNAHANRFPGEADKHREQLFDTIDLVS